MMPMKCQGLSFKARKLSTPAISRQAVVDQSDAISAALLQVCIVAVSQGSIIVKAHAWDRELGGRDLDAILMTFLAQGFQKRTGHDIMADPKARYRLAKEVSQCRQLLTVSKQASVVVDNIMKSQDFR